MSELKEKWTPKAGETYDNLKDHIYHRSAGISKSTLAMMSCPRKIKAKAKPQTDSMRDGSVLHKAILEPDDFLASYVMLPSTAKLNTNKGKEVKAQLIADNPTKEVIKQDIYEKALMMKDAVHAHTLARELLSEGKAEQSHYFNDGRTGELCKMRTDWRPKASNIIVDVKRSASASPRMFAKYVHDFKYHWQDAWYTRGINADDFYFLVVEEYSDKPMVEVYRLSNEAKAQGLREVDAALDKYLLCKAFNDWPSYNDQDSVTIIDLPKWARG